MRGVDESNRWQWYGLVETFGGLLKLVMVLSISIYLYAIADDGVLPFDMAIFLHQLTHAVSSPGFEHGQGFSSDASALWLGYLCTWLEISAHC